MNNRIKYSFIIASISGIIVIAIAFFVVPKIMQPSELSRCVRAKSDTKSLSEKIKQYKRETQRYPSMQKGLIALIEPIKYISRLILDP